VETFVDIVDHKKQIVESLFYEPLVLNAFKNRGTNASFSKMKYLQFPSM